MKIIVNINQIKHSFKLFGIGLGTNDFVRYYGPRGRVWLTSSLHFKDSKSTTTGRCTSWSGSKGVFKSCRNIYPYLTSCALDICKESKRVNISTADIFAALEEVEFDDYKEPLRVFLNKYREEQKAKQAQQLAETVSEDAAMENAEGSSSNQKESVVSEGSSGKEIA